MLTENPLHGLRDRLLVMRSMPNFASLADQDLTLVAEHARERRFKKGELLFDNERVDRLYIVLAGKVAVMRNGKLVTVIEGQGGVGTLSLLANDDGLWRAVAEADTLVLAVPEGPFRAALKESFPLFRNSLRLTAMTILKRRGNLPVTPERAPPAETGERPERQATLVERMIQLRARGGPFASGNMDALIELARRTTQFEVPAGHRFWDIGDPSSYSIRVVYGILRCTAADGSTVRVGTEFVLGGMDAWSVQPRSYSAIAETDVVAYRTEVDDLLEVLELQPDLALDLLAALARALINMPP
ncbi:MAG: transcriptional regulator, Crp/Fnr family [Myxococcaceae bacterium]|jgi:CRP-like cAMP-binding protein|nr:transcriptional regulator, Crp/Fnr family [Myxococcaceae bacterium]